MKNILLRIESRLDDLTKAFHQLRTENEILRKEITGVSPFQNSEPFGLMETRTLREIVERTEFCVNKINWQNLKNESDHEVPRKSKPQGKVKAIETYESDSESSEEFTEEFPVVEIRTKTLADEREFLKESFNKLIKEKKVKDGESLRGTSVQTISNSNPGTSCTMKLSNFLESALTDLQCHCWIGSRHSGPTRVVGNFSEVFSFRGDMKPYASYCTVLCSFAISKVLRLAIYCNTHPDGTIRFAIGFTPADVPTNETLFFILNEMPPAPDVWMMNKEWSEIPLELFVTRGNLLVRGHMTNGPRSMVHVEILELNGISWPHSVFKGKKRLSNGKAVEFNQSTNKGGSISGSVGKCRFSCNVEIVNCLNVPLRNRNKFYSNSNDKDFWPLEIQSFHRESFLGSSDTNFEAMFSYEILSTDLALVIALKVGPGTNSFAASFAQIPAVTEKKDLEALMNPNEWKVHEYVKYSNTSKTLDIISVRNIRAEILMTETEKSVLKIRIYAV